MEIAVNGITRICRTYVVIKSFRKLARYLMALPRTQPSPCFEAPCMEGHVFLQEEECHIMKICISIMPVLLGPKQYERFYLSLSPFLFSIGSTSQKTVLLNIGNPLVRM